MGILTKAKEMIFGKPAAPAPAPTMNGGGKKGKKTATKKTAAKKTATKKKTAKK